MVQNELYHHGTKGMKWGVRRYQDRNGRLTALGKKRRQINYDPDSKAAHDGRRAEELTTKELQERNKRLNLEKNYNDLTRKKSKAKAIIIGAATAIATSYVNKYAQKGASYVEGIIKDKLKNVKIK